MRLRTVMACSVQLYASIFLAFVCFLPNTAQAQSVATANQLSRPNVVVIYTDDQGYGDAHCLNPASKFKTPNMDRLAREGILFSDGHSPDSVCTPSRYGLLTGRYSWRTSLKTGVMGAEGKCLIDSDRATIATLFREAGYHTGMVGKWHLGMTFPGKFGVRDWSQPVEDMPLDHGLDYFFGIPASMNYGVLTWFEGRFPTSAPNRFTSRKPNARHIDFRFEPPYAATPAEVLRKLKPPAIEISPDFTDNQCLTRFTDQAITWMESKLTDSRQGKPFFLYLPLTSPHYPVCPLPEFYGQGQAGGYGEFMIETDHHVGRILKFLEDSQIDANTLIVFTSDNGPENSWPQRLEEFQHASNGGLRDGKRAVYEGGHRVPFFVRWPASIRSPGRVYEEPVCQTDLMRTFADMLQVPLGESTGEDSHSFYPALLDENYHPPKPTPLVHHSAVGRFAVRLGDWKLVMQHRNKAQELYNLRLDPSESNNVLEQYPQRAAELEQTITSIIENGRSTPGIPQPNDTPWWEDLAWMPSKP